MNKTTTINLAGFQFIIDELAYEKLENYLNALRSTLQPNEIQEVMYDIELRIVEIFRQQLHNREVVNVQDVQQLIELLGTPEQIENEERKKDSSNQKKSKKQLFRNPQNKIMAGVCSGLSVYLNIDVVWIRLIFVFLVFTTRFFFLLYLILWIIVPKAKTTNDFLKMKGVPLTFDNIKDFSQDFYQETVEKNKKHYNNQEHLNKYSSTSAILAKNFFNKIVLRFAATVLGIITGGFAFAFLMMSIILLLTLPFTNSEISLLNWIDFYNNNLTLSILMYILFTLSSIAGLWLFSLITIRLFNWNYKPKFIPHLSMAFIVGVLTSLLLCLSIIKNLIIGISFGSSISKKYEIQTTSDTLTVDVKKMNLSEKFKFYPSNVYSDKKLVYKTYDYKIDVKRKNVSFPYLIVKHSQQNQQKNIIQFPIEIKNNELILPQYVSYRYENRKNFQGNLRLELILPEKTTLINKSYETLFLNHDYFEDVLEDLNFNEENEQFSEIQALSKQIKKAAIKSTKESLQKSLFNMENKKEKSSTSIINFSVNSEDESVMITINGKTKRYKDLTNEEKEKIKKLDFNIQ